MLCPWTSTLRHFSRNSRVISIKKSQSSSSSSSTGNNSCSSCCHFNHDSKFSGPSLLPAALLSPSSPVNFMTSRRTFSSEASSSSSLILPPLTPAFPPILWPKFTNSLKNLFFTNFVIRPYMDPEFNLADFDKGARAAVVHVSQKLAQGEFDDLDELVEPSTLEEIKRNISKFTVSQRERLAVNMDDILFSFPYQIGIIIPDSLPKLPGVDEVKTIPPQRRFVEVTTVLHVIKGRSSHDEEKSFEEFLVSEEVKEKTMVVNVRFFRDFTEGQESSWIIKDMLNFFVALDIPILRK